MSGPNSRMAIDVGELRKGMYIAQPDRPWIELPLPFAGFTLQTDEEMRILREYCKYVYVDPERCAESLNEAELTVLNPVAEKQPEETPEQPAEIRVRRRSVPEDDGIHESRREVDTDKLKTQMEAAGRVLSDARRFLDDAFSSAGDGKSVDVNSAQSTITDLIIRLTKNPTASLLLTSLNDRDSFTSTHSVHMCVLALAFCLRAKLDNRQLEILGLGALLHDIGKVLLPEEMMNRAGPLTEEEWELVKQHPIESRRILAESGKVPRAALNIASMHHERRDGTGYPHGLTKKELPEYVLVTGLVNRYQSLTSPRPYRGAQAADQVLQSFYSNSDSMFGSRPVEAFIRCIGIYPVGSLVELDNGALAVVVSSRPNTRLRPTVQLVRTPDDEPYDKLVLINLAAEAERSERKSNVTPIRKVRRVRNPSETGIDPGAVIAESFGVQIA